MLDEGGPSVSSLPFLTAPFQNCSCLKASLLHSPPASEEDAAAPPEDHSVSSHAPPPVQNHHLLLVYVYALSIYRRLG